MLKLLEGDVWTDLTEAARSATRIPAAVAYFSKGADRLLRLPEGSVLVCDASLPTVRSGATHPESLARLVRKGVRVYSRVDLHAKVFVLDDCAYVGSANASRSSAVRLLEAVVVTDDKRLVSAARKLVMSLALEPLSPKVLRRLQREYRPPRNVGARSHRRRSAVYGATPLKVVQLQLTTHPAEEAVIADAGRRTAKRRRQHGGMWEVQEFRITGRTSLKPGDSVLQVVDVGGHSQLVEPPGTVLHVRNHRTKRGNAAYVFVEVRRIARRPTRRQITDALGRAVGKRLGKGRPLPRTLADGLRRYFEGRN